MTATHPNLNIPIRVAIAFMALRLLFYFLDWQWDPAPLTLIIPASIAIVVLIPLSIYSLWPRNTIESLLEGIVASMRITLVYSILVTIFFYLYYSLIDVNYFPEMRDFFILRDTANSPQDQHVKIIESIEEFFTIGKFTLLLLISFMAFSLFYSIFFTAIKRVALKRKA